MENPLVTIICTCYNHESYVVEALNSVKNQTYTEVELIIVDDFSSDNSTDVINNWLLKNPSSKFISNTENMGLTKSFNNAVKSASGDYLMDLAADDLLHPNCIEKLLSTFMTSDENTGLVFGNAELVDESEKFISLVYDEIMVEKVKSALNINFYKYLLSDSAYMCSVSGLYKKETFLKLNGYDEKLYFEDLDYWLRISKKSNISFTNNVVVKKRRLVNSMGNGFFITSEHTKKLHMSFYIILEKCYHLNNSKKEYIALTKRIYKQCRWAVKTYNVKYFSLYIILLLKTYIRIVFSKKVVSI